MPRGARFGGDHMTDRQRAFGLPTLILPISVALVISLVSLPPSSAYAGGARDLEPYRFRYAVEDSKPFFLIENITRAGGNTGTITYRAFLGGQKIAEKTIPML